MISRYLRAYRSPVLVDSGVQDVSDDGSGESSEDGEDEDKDSDIDGERDVRKEFNLGRYCAARTQIYHQFSHWEVRPIMQDARTRW